VTHPVVNCLYL